MATVDRLMSFLDLHAAIPMSGDIPVAEGGARQSLARFFPLKRIWRSRSTTKTRNADIESAFCVTRNIPGFFSPLPGAAESGNGTSSTSFDNINILAPRFRDDFQRFDFSAANFSFDRRLHRNV